MEIEKKKSLVLGIFVILIILLALLYAFWGVINRGTLKVIGEAPFQVRIFEGESFDCDFSPCDIRLKSGDTGLIISKNGFRSIVTEIKIPLWRTLEFNANFEIEPTLERVADDLQFASRPIYQLVYDEKLQMQKIVTPYAIEQVLMYLPKAILLPKIIGSVGDSSVLIIDRGVSPQVAYRIDLKEKSKTGLDNFNFNLIEEGKWSASGKYLILSIKGKENLWLLDEQNNFKDLPLKTDIERVAWFLDEENRDVLIFVGPQEFGSGALLERISVDTYTFGNFMPAINDYSEIKTFTRNDLPEMPDSLFVIGDGKSVYFQSGEENFRIILK